MTSDQNAQHAFEKLFLEYFKPLCGYCQLKFRFDIEAAKDIVHNVFARVIESHKKQSGELPSGSYLFAAVRNACLDRLRHENIKADFLRLAEKGAVQSEWDQSHISVEFKALERSIHEAIAGLPDQMRLIFQLSRFEQLKYAQIAERLEISVKTVETQMGRALQKLRIALSDHLDYCFLVFLISDGYQKFLLGL